MDENEFELDLNEDEDQNESTETQDTTDYKAEAEKWKASALRYKKKAERPQQQVQAPPAADLDAKLERLELKTEGYSDDAIAFIQSNGGKKALENDYVKAAVTSIQQQRLAEAAMVVDESAKSDFERTHTAAEIANMTPEELYKVLPKASK
jgi:hypothetical protein